VAVQKVVELTGSGNSVEDAVAEDWHVVYRFDTSIDQPVPGCLNVPPSNERPALQ
jgi:sorbitol-specific phosphotransferase system component IIA